METPKAKDFEDNLDYTGLEKSLHASFKVTNDNVDPHLLQPKNFLSYPRPTGPCLEYWAAPVDLEQSAGINNFDLARARNGMRAALQSHPFAHPTPRDMSKYYPSPISSVYTSPMSSVTISPTPVSTPMSSVYISQTSTTQADATPSYDYLSSTGNIQTPNYSYPEISVGIFGSGDVSKPVCSSFNPSDSCDSGYQSGFTRTVAASPITTSTFDSGYGSCSQRPKSSTPAPSESDSDSDSDSDDETVMQESDEETASRRRSHKRSRVYIHVEDLISCFQKKRRLNSIESLPLDPQIHKPLEKKRPSRIDLTSPHSTTRSATMDCGTQTLDVPAQNQFTNKNPDQVTVQITDARDIDSDVDCDGSDSDEDDEALSDETDSEHKFNLFDMLALDNFDFVQCPTDSSNESRNGKSVTTGSSKATPSSLTTGSLGFMTPSPQADKEKSPVDGVVAVGTNETPPNLNFGPLELRCWHAAYGFPCPGKTGTSPDVRHLLDDHSCSKKSSNNHKLPPKCQLCDRLFENEQLADEHRAKLKIKSEQCSVLPPEELAAINSPVNLKGISPDRRIEIDTAIQKFNKNRELPQGCDPTEFNIWIARNRPIHIGRSTRTKAAAERELGKWFVVWFTQFPNKQIPYHPFDDAGLDPKKCERILEFSMSNILEDSSRRLLPEFTQEHQDRIRQHIRNGMELQWLELLQERNSTQKARKARMPPTSNPSPSPLSMATPAPKEPTFFPPDHPSSATFKPPSPGGIMDPPPTPSPDAPTPSAAALVTGIPFPPSTQGNGEEGNEAEDEEEEPEFDPCSYQGSLLQVLKPFDFENPPSWKYPPA